MPCNDNEHPIILFDGVFNLFNGSVQFIIKRDPKQHFRFASFQSSFGENVLEQLHLSFDEKHLLSSLKKQAGILLFLHLFRTLYINGLLKTAINGLAKKKVA